jgi:cardiolipin synthase A/B
MRIFRGLAVLAGALLLATTVATLAGCGGGKSAPTYSLVTEPGGYQPIYDFISGAKKSIDMTIYSLSDPTAQQALKAAAKRGVKVRVLFDSDTEGGGGPKTNQPAYDDLNANGVKVKWAWPGTLWHQKSIIRDGDSAAVMSCNLCSPYYSVVRDYVIITDNHATATGMEATFAKDWDHTDVAPMQGVVPAGSDLIWPPGAEPGLVQIIDSARPGTTIWAEDEQLASQPIEQAFIKAVARGVTVNFTMTYDKAFATDMNTLAAGGVHLRIYQMSATTLYIHAKALVVNGETAYAGSINFTSAMTDQNRNVGLIVTDPGVAKGMTATMAGDFAGAAPYTPGQ